MKRRAFMAAATAAASAGSVARGAPASRMGIASTAVASRRVRDTLELLEYCHSLGAGGLQANLSSLEPGYVRKLRARAEGLGMYFEVSARLPEPDDPAAFERVVMAAREAGAACIRSVCLGGRRYENFATLEEWRAFAALSRRKLRTAAPILTKYRVRLALENHKDWTLEEFVPLLAEFGGEYFGATLDTGNNLAMLDDPAALVREVAPYAYSVHLKDMGVAEYKDGYLLSEVIFGDGFLNLKSMVEAIRARQPRVNFSLEMITRDPLEIAVLQQEYWATWPDRRASELAHMLAIVRNQPSEKPLPRVSQLDAAARMAAEEENNKHCLAYAREHLGL
jgi:3-oxoisoapionate decarboxylase